MKRDLLSWWTRPQWLRNPGSRNRTLFAGPWVGEFGWELLNWQGWVRKLAPYYDRVLVCSRTPSESLYAGVADEFIPHQIKGVPDHVICRQIENPEELTRIQGLITSGMDHLVPRLFVPAAAQDFQQLGEVDAVDSPCEVLIHARGKGAHTQRNWPMDRWVALCEEIQNSGKRVGAIGLSSDTLDVPGIEDFRDVPLQETLNRIRSARVVLGPSSGPMHLASLCGTPHLVWTNRGNYRMGKTSREKYETWWNPFQTPVEVLEADTFDHSLEDVLRGVRRLIPDA